jgi:hypothetical protein
MLNKDVLKEDHFEPEIMEAMRAAYRMALGAPQLENAAEVTTEIILAEKIIELAEEGETDPERLCSGALRRLLH